MQKAWMYITLTQFSLNFKINTFVEQKYVMGSIDRAIES